MLEMIAAFMDCHERFVDADSLELSFMEAKNSLFDSSV
jgi:hypothetical protein